MVKGENGLSIFYLCIFRVFYMHFYKVKMHIKYTKNAQIKNILITNKKQKTMFFFAEAVSAYTG